MPLTDDIIVYPAHGAGSACGKNMSSETTDTLGNQKKTNYALDLSLTKEDFITAVLTGLKPPPGYFPQNVMLNIQGYDSLDSIMEKGVQELSARSFESLVNETDAVILDTRSKDDFRKGYVPNSIFMGLDGSFASWVGTLVADVKQKIVFIADVGKEEEVVMRLARVGYDNTLGFLKGGVAAWKEAGFELDHVNSVSVAELESSTKGDDIIDVRRSSEYDSEHINGAINVPLDHINDHLAQVNKSTDQYVHCASGYRSLVFISILQARGYRNLIDVKEGMAAIKDNGSFKLSEFVCPTTML